MFIFVGNNYHSLACAMYSDPMGPSFAVYLEWFSQDRTEFCKKISAPHRLMEAYQIPHFRLDKLYLLRADKYVATATVSCQYLF
jgi:hypothetical protein